MVFLWATQQKLSGD